MSRWSWFGDSIGAIEVFLRVMMAEQVVCKVNIEIEIKSDIELGTCTHTHTEILSMYLQYNPSS